MIRSWKRRRGFVGVLVLGLAVAALQRFIQNVEQPSRLEYDDEREHDGNHDENHQRAVVGRLRLSRTSRRTASMSRTRRVSLPGPARLGLGGRRTVRGSPTRMLHRRYGSCEPPVVRRAESPTASSGGSGHRAAHALRSSTLPRRSSR